MAGLKKFGDFEISQRADGNPIELSRLPNEFVVLALDTRLDCLVELHILRNQSVNYAGILTDVASKRDVLGNRGQSFLPILKSGVEDDMVYYSTPLNEGESLQTYINRLGAMPSSTVFGLILTLLDELVNLKNHSVLFDSVDLKGLHISLLEDVFLRLVVVDYKFKQAVLAEASTARETIFVKDVCVLIFNMLTGKTFSHDNTDNYPVLRALPSGLRTLLRATLLQTSGQCFSLDELRGEVRGALMIQCRGMGEINSRRHLMVEDSKIPHHTIKNTLLNSDLLNQLLSKQFKFDEIPQVRDAFAVTGLNLRTDVLTNIQLLPARGVLQGSRSTVAASEIYRIDPELHPNLYPVQGAWEGDAFSVVMEESMHGISLSRLLLHRNSLNHAETLIVLKQVSNAILQAQQCEVPLNDLHPRNLFLRFDDDLPSREMEKLLQKRLDVWPKIHLLVRSHLTMQSLNPPLVLDGGEKLDASNTRSCPNRNFIALAALLLTGVSWAHSDLSFSEAIPLDLVMLIKGQLDLSMVGKGMEIEEFLREYEQCIPKNEEMEVGLELRSVANLYVEKVRHVDNEVMEHVGAVSDFAEDNMEQYVSCEDDFAYVENKYQRSSVPSKNTIGRFFEDILFRRRRREA